MPVGLPNHIVVIDTVNDEVKMQKIIPHMIVQVPHVTLCASFLDCRRKAML